jgi:predicted small integral membrane protein
MIALRHAKIALLAASGLFFLIVVLNNAVFDYPSNYAFVQHVLSMDTLFSGEAQRWRAFPDPTPEDGSYWFHHAFYWSIILWEAAAGALCFAGAWKLWKHRAASASAFHAAKSLAVYGLALTLLQWFTAFITVGAEWFLMWQSSTWNGQDAAARMFMIFGIILLLVALRDEELPAA